MREKETLVLEKQGFSVPAFALGRGGLLACNYRKARFYRRWRTRYSGSGSGSGQISEFGIGLGLGLGLSLE